ncbi:MAG: hypothetical protein UX98_C0015G0016 [Parcubacteria group bacterium GW2011_GWA2_47_26]|nr:MAG: hypothetical protein UX98_C0015G0016 [Parcubacteria group bacterium GW2011_GWA2_47_26]
MGKSAETPRGLGPDISRGLPEGAPPQKVRREEGRKLEEEPETFLLHEMQQVDDKIRVIAREQHAEARPPAARRIGVRAPEDELASHRQRTAKLANKLETLQARLAQIKLAWGALTERNDSAQAIGLVNEMIADKEKELPAAGERAQEGIAATREKDPEDAREADHWTQEIARYSRLFEAITWFPQRARFGRMLDIARANFDETKLGQVLRTVSELDRRLDYLRKVRARLER